METFTTLKAPVACVAGDFLHLILMPTEQCNFRCVYCYEDFEAGRMEPEVVRGIRNLLTRRAEELEQLSVAWFGGEPLLALDIVEEIQTHVKDLEARWPALQCTSSMTTNGYGLDAGTFARLIQLGVREYQVTFDGPRAVHDTKRLRLGGQGSFDRIWENLQAAQRSPEEFSILIRLHIDADSRSSIGEFLEHFHETFGTDPRFRLHLWRLSRMGGPNDDGLPILGRRETRQAVQEGRRHAESLGLKLNPHTKADSICYASRANAFVVRSDGALAKCTVALSDPTNNVGRLRPDGTMKLEQDKLFGWMRGLFSGEESELACPLQGISDPEPKEVARAYGQAPEVRSPSGGVPGP